MDTHNQILLSEQTEVERSVFYKKTYLHVAGAVLAFIIVESILLNTVPEALIFKMISSNWIWMGLLGLLWVGGMVSSKFAHSYDMSKQYFGLSLYVVLEAVIFLPIIYIVMNMGGGIKVISQAATVTLFLVLALTAVAFFSKTNFSFLRTGLMIGGILAIGFIIAGMFFGFNLGLWFSIFMVILMAAAIIYQTSQLIHEYASHQYVGASLGLFSSFMTMFWYILRIFMSRD